MNNKKIEVEIPDDCKQCKKRSWMCAPEKIKYNCFAKEMLRNDAKSLWDGLHEWKESFLKRDISDIKEMMSPYPDLYFYGLLLIDVEKRLKKVEETLFDVEPRARSIIQDKET